MRKIFLPLAIICCSLISGAQTPVPENFSIQKLADGVYAAIAIVGGHAVSNSGIVDLGDATLIFDSFYSPEAAEDLKKTAEQLTGHPVKYVVNSHFHDDHIQGNQVFEGAEIISTTKTRSLIEENEPATIEDDKKEAADALKKWQNKTVSANDAHAMAEKKMWIAYYEAIVQALPTLTMILPNVTFSDSMEIHGSKRAIQLISYGAGHTPSDLFMYLPAEHIAFLGDLLFIQNQPWLGDGDVKNWMQTLDEISKMNVNVLVPGHGPVGDTSSIRTMRQYIQVVNQTAQSYIDKKISPENDSLLKSPPPYDRWMLSAFFVPNVIGMYESMMKQ